MVEPVLIEPNSIRREAVAGLLAADPFASSLGIKLTEVGPASITIEMTVTESMTNVHGRLHGGALFSMADTALALYSNSYGFAAVVIDAHMAFTAAVNLGVKLTAVVEEVHKGRTLATYQVLIHREDRKIAAHFTGTVFVQADVPI